MEKNKQNKNQEKKKRKIRVKTISEIVKIFCSIATVIISGIALFFTVPTAIQNSNEQTQVVIEPRDGDIIVKDGDDYKLLQLINYEDISFPTKVQEIQYSYSDSVVYRVEINNTNNVDWSKKDSFRYVINNFSINPNKVINLLENIDSITVYCDFYEEKNISTYIDLKDFAFKFEMKELSNESCFELAKTNEKSLYEYVTNELNDGIEWVKIKVEILYNIGNMKILDTITSDWMKTDADIA